MFEKPAIPDESLRLCLQEQFNISTIKIEFLPLGFDSRAGVYRVVSEAGAVFLLKVNSRLLYKASCFVPYYLAGQGITGVVAPLPTRENFLWTRLEGWTVLLYLFYEGFSGWDTPMSEAEWEETGRVLKQIHEAAIPAEFLNSVRNESFNPQEYINWIKDFEKQQLHSPGKNKFEQELLAGWRMHQAPIHRLLNLMEKLARRLQEKSGPFVICHADLHPGNLIRRQDGRVFVIDWDEVMLAPRERDFLFIKETPFFAGYGEVKPDWNALTYYRCERVIQDLIAYAQDVFFRDDLGEESKQAMVESFFEILSENGEIKTVFEAATHLPAN
jgi:spectinomycin phosphotransferase